MVQDSKAPLISCVMAVNRDDGFLDQAVQSVLAQSFTDFEFVIVANNCSDELWRSLQAVKDSRIRLFRTSLGQLPYNLNYGVDQARGEWIARMDADDVCLPQRFARQIEYLTKNPNVDVLGTYYEELGGSGNVYRPPLDHDSIARQMPWTSCLAHPTVIFRKRMFIESRGYAYSLYAEDYELWLRLLRMGKARFANISEVLLQYRLHDAQSSAGLQRRANFPAVGSLLFREFLLTGRIVFLLSMIKRWLGGFKPQRRIQP